MIAKKKLMSTVGNSLQLSTPTSGKNGGPRAHRSGPGNHSCHHSTWSKNIANHVPSYKLTNWGKDINISVMKTILEAKLNVSNEFRLALEQGKGRLFIEGTMDAFLGAGIPYHVVVHTNHKN